MKPLLSLLILSCSLSLFGATKESVVNQFLLKNWNIAKTNMPHVVALEKQLAIKQSELAKASQDLKDRRAMLDAKAIASGTDITIVAQKRRELEPLVQLERKLSSDVRMLEAKIEVFQLEYYKRTRKAVEAFVDNTPELLGTAPKLQR